MLREQKKKEKRKFITVLLKHHGKWTLIKKIKDKVVKVKLIFFKCTKILMKNKYWKEKFH